MPRNNEERAERKREAAERRKEAKQAQFKQQQQQKRQRQAQNRRFRQQRAKDARREKRLNAANNRAIKEANFQQRQRQKHQAAHDGEHNREVRRNGHGGHRGHREVHTKSLLGGLLNVSWGTSVGHSGHDHDTVVVHHHYDSPDRSEPKEKKPSAKEVAAKAGAAGGRSSDRGSDATSKMMAEKREALAEKIEASGLDEQEVEALRIAALKDAGYEQMSLGNTEASQKPGGEKILPYARMAAYIDGTMDLPGDAQKKFESRLDSAIEERKAEQKGPEGVEGQKADGPLGSMEGQSLSGIGAILTALMNIDKEMAQTQPGHQPGDLFVHLQQVLQQAGLLGGAAGGPSSTSPGMPQVNAPGGSDEGPKAAAASKPKEEEAHKKPKQKSPGAAAP